MESQLILKLIFFSTYFTFIIWISPIINFSLIIESINIGSFCFPGLFTVANLIGCQSEELKLALSTRKMRVGNDTIVQKLKLSQVRSLFLFLFLWVKKHASGFVILYCWFIFVGFLTTSLQNVQHLVNCFCFTFVVFSDMPVSHICFTTFICFFFPWHNFLRAYILEES